jgi:DNA polymerase-4
MDAFFASVEQRDFPELKGKPVIVGSADRRGVVAAASYEARAYGVHSAMPTAVALQKCPFLVIQPHRFEVYRRVSLEIRSIFKRYTDRIEPLSLDEAFLDVSSNKKGMESATEIAREIRKSIWEETQLTASAGISYSKFLAKLASDINKPNGQKLIHPQKAQAFIDALPVRKFFGVGKATGLKMEKAGIIYGKDLKRFSKEALQVMFGKQGEFYYEICRGIDNRPVKPQRKRKSLSVEHTYTIDLSGSYEMHRQIERLSQELWKRAGKAGYKGRTLTLKYKFDNFEQHTRSKTTVKPLIDCGEIKALAEELLTTPAYPKHPVRLLGLGLSGNESDLEKDLQLTLRLD